MRAITMKQGMAGLLALIATAPAAAQWKEEIKVSYSYDARGHRLPPRGIYLGIYYMGGIDGFAGGHEDEIAVRVTLLRVRSETMGVRDYPHEGSLRCQFYFKHPVGMTSAEQAGVSVSAGNQAGINVKHGQVVKIQVPDHVSWVRVSLHADEVPRGELAVFEASRPYRKAAMRKIEREQARQRERQAVQSGKQVIEEDCPQCRGSGKIRVPEKEIECKHCEGTGWWPPNRLGRRWRCGQDPMSKLGTKNCGGRRKIIEPAHNASCGTCQGKGKVRKVVERPLANAKDPRVDAKMSLQGKSSSKVLSLAPLDIYTLSLKIERLKELTRTDLSRSFENVPVFKVILMAAPEKRSTRIIRSHELVTEGIEFYLGSDPKLKVTASLAKGPDEVLFSIRRAK